MLWDRLCFQAEDSIRGFCLSRGLGDVEKRQLISSDVASTADEHFVFMSGLGLWFFGHNDGKSPLD